MAVVLDFKFGHPAGAFPAGGMFVPFARVGPEGMAMAKTNQINGLWCLPSPTAQSDLADPTDLVGGFRQTEA